MKFLQLLIAAILLIGFACQTKKENAEHQHATEQGTQPATDTTKKSIPKEEHAMIGDTHITIKYHAPSVRGRQIWGGLVPYGDVWVTGAHRATSFEINKDFEINGKIIPAGKYALFTIPGQEKWTFIINKKWDQHLADEYTEAEDVLRLEVKPQQIENSLERLKYSVTIDSKTAMLNFRWEKIKLSIPFTIQ
jgi:hypothetical protein